jgi:hypothetical protein
MGGYKRFDKALFAKYDALARKATIKALEARGYTAKDNPDTYAQDLIATKDGKQFLVECEIKAVWQTDTFPYDSVQLPERKKKFFNKPTLFFIWNKHTSKAAVFWDHHVKDLTPVEVPNKYLDKTENFFQIPIERVRFI